MFWFFFVMFSDVGFSLEYQTHRPYWDLFIACISKWEQCWGCNESHYRSLVVWQQTAAEQLVYKTLFYDDLAAKLCLAAGSSLRRHNIRKCWNLQLTLHNCYYQGAESVHACWHKMPWHSIWNTSIFMKNVFYATVLKRQQAAWSSRHTLRHLLLLAVSSGARKTANLDRPSLSVCYCCKCIALKRYDKRWFDWTGLMTLAHPPVMYPAWFTPHPSCTSAVPTPLTKSLLEIVHFVLLWELIHLIVSGCPKSCFLSSIRL